MNWFINTVIISAVKTENMCFRFFATRIFDKKQRIWYNLYAMQVQFENNIEIGE